MAREKYLEDDGPGAMRMLDRDCVGVSGDVAKEYEAVVEAVKGSFAEYCKKSIR